MTGLHYRSLSALCIEEVVEACERAVAQDEALVDVAASLEATEEAAREVRRLMTPKEAS